MYRIAVHLLVALLLGIAATTTQAGTPPDFECAEYMAVAHGIVTPEEWTILNSITQVECEALFYKMSYVTLVEYLESGHFVNDLVLYELMECEHFREYHCKNCDPLLSCDAINVIGEKYYNQKARDSLGWGERIMMFLDWLTAVIR